MRFLSLAILIGLLQLQYKVSDQSTSKKSTLFKIYLLNGLIWLDLTGREFGKFVLTSTKILPN